MLNLVAHDEEADKELLEDSFNSIQQKDFLEIVTDEEQKAPVLDIVRSLLPAPPPANISFQNLFRLNSRFGQFHIAQCLVDFGYSIAGRIDQAANAKYHFQLVGIARIRYDLGKTLMRPETLGDKIVGRIFGNDIDLQDAKKISSRYYLVSDKKNTILQAFDKHFISTIEKYDGLVILTHGNQMVVTFETGLEREQSGIAEDVLTNCRFLAD